MQQSACHRSVNISVNIARKIKYNISKSKLILCEWNAFYFSDIAFIDFTLHEIKQCIVFFGTPGRSYYRKGSAAVRTTPFLLQ